MVLWYLNSILTRVSSTKIYIMYQTPADGATYEDNIIYRNRASDSKQKTKKLKHTEKCIICLIKQSKEVGRVYSWEWGTRDQAEWVG